MDFPITNFTLPSGDGDVPRTGFAYCCAFLVLLGAPLLMRHGHPDICTSAKQTCKCHQKFFFQTLAVATTRFRCLKQRGICHPRFAVSVSPFHIARCCIPPPLWPCCYFFLKAVHCAKSSCFNAHQSSQLSPPSITSNKIYPPADTLINLLSYLSLFVGITIIDGLDLM